MVDTLGSRGIRRRCRVSLGDASFRAATFNGDTSFPKTTFGGEASFREATFGGKASFRWATFSVGEGSLDFERSRVLSADARHSWPTGWCLGPEGDGGYTVVREEDAGRS